jgi:cobalt/nickel transport system permease protein
MHIPDGFLDAKTAVATAVLAGAGVAVALQQAQIHMPRRKVPLMGLTAAFIFAAQMLNFPVVAGTSGHLVGAVLATVLLGPAPAVLVMTAVLLVQSLLFADGGLLALGANVFNMALVAPLAGYGVYRVMRLVARTETGRIFAVAFASWCSIVFAAMVCAGELAWSSTSSWSVVFPAMVDVHMAIGVGEAIISSLVVVAVAKARPEFLKRETSSVSRMSFMVWALVLIFGLVIFISPFASEWPDGLERVASALGFDQQAVARGFPSFGYATLWAGLTGTLAALALSLVLARIVTRKTDHDR